MRLVPDPPQYFQRLDYVGHLQAHLQSEGCTMVLKPTLPNRLRLATREASTLNLQERELFIANLLVRIHYIIEMILLTGGAP